MAEQQRPSLETIYMELAQLLARRSTCERLQVGAVIASQDLEQIYAVGYNGGAKGQRNDCDRNEPGNCGHIHAEINALIKCSIKDRDKVAFLTDSPCPVCAKALVNSGFSAVYYGRAYRDTAGLEILGLAGIQSQQLDLRPRAFRREPECSLCSGPPGETPDPGG